MPDLVNILRESLFGVDPYHALVIFFLIFTRFLVISFLVPFLGAELLPSLARIGLCTILSGCCFVMVIKRSDYAIDLATWSIVLFFIKEALIGFLIGFLVSLIFYTYELFGEIVDLARAASMSRLFIPEIKHQSSAMGSLFFQIALIMFISLGFHRDVLATLFDSFIVFPVTSFRADHLQENFFPLALNLMLAVFETAFRLALPIVVVCFLIDLAFGLMNRVAPQINAYFLSLPAKMVGGLVMLFFSLSFLLDDFESHYQIFLPFLMSLVH